jgi:hypothetical protein
MNKPSSSRPPLQSTKYRPWEINGIRNLFPSEKVPDAVVFLKGKEGSAAMQLTENCSLVGEL